jgi:hypothetical protein
MWSPPADKGVDAGTVKDCAGEPRQASPNRAAQIALGIK